MPGKTRGLPDSFSCPCSVKDQCMDIPEPWMERLLPYTDLLKGVEWQDSNGRVFFLDDHGVFRPFSWDRLASGEMCDWRELEGLPYNIGEILQQFTSMPLDRIHHYAYMGEYLRVLYDEKKLLDVLIHVGNKVFAAHRIALACHSIYFSRAFILTHHHDNKLSEVILNGIDPAAFQTILRFIYSGILYVNDCNVQSLLAVAGTLQIPAVYFRCRDFLGTLTLEPSPLREVNPNAIRMKYSHIIDNFGYAATMDVFYALPVDTVEVILGDDNIKVSSEMEVFDAVMNWIGYEPGLRRRHMDRLMQKVRFPCMSCEEVIQCSQANDQVSYSPALKNKIMEATWILTLRKVNSYDPFHLPCPHPRKCFSEGLYSSSSKNTGEILQQFTSMPLDCIHHYAYTGEYLRTLYDEKKLIVISAVKSQYSVGGMHAECTLFSKADEENIVFAPPLCSTFREPSGDGFTVPSTPVTGPSLYHPPQSPVKSAPEIVGNYVENSVAPPLLQKSSSSGAPAYLQFKASELVLETQQQETLTPSSTPSSTPSVMSVANEGKSRRDKSRTKGQTSKASGIFSRAESNPEITVELQIQGENSKLQGISAGLTISPPDKSINRDKKKTDSTLMPGGSLDNRRSPGHSPAGGETSSKSPLNKTERASSRSRAKAKKTSTNSGSQSRFPGPMSKEGATSQISEKFSSEVFQFSQASKTDSVLRGSSSTSSSQDFHPNLLPLTVESSSSSTLPPTSPFSTPSPTVIQLKEVPQPYLKFYINDEQGEGRITVVKSNSSSTSTVSLPPGVGDILAVGGFMETDDNESASQTSLYNGDNRNWHRFSNMPETRINFAAAFLNDVLYVIGGYDPHDMDCMCRAARDVFTFDLKTQRWDKVGDLNHPRSFLAACALNGKLYAMGGQDDRENVLETAEVYDPATGKWSFIAPMTCARVSACAVGYEGKVIVVGGYGRADNDSTPCPVLASTECYDPKTNLWQSMGPLRMPRAQASMVQMNRKLFLCGGAAHDPSTGKLSSIKSVDIYDPASGVWSHLSDLKTARHNAGATVIGHKIYVVGGISAHNNEILRSVECFDTETNTWITSVPDLPLGAKSLSCIVVPEMMNYAL